MRLACVEMVIGFALVIVGITLLVLGAGGCG